MEDTGNLSKHSFGRWSSSKMPKGNGLKSELVTIR